MLALLLEDEGFSLAAEPSIIPRRGGDNPVLSFAQERLWFLHQLEPNSAYNIPDAFRLRGRLNIAALQQSLNDLVQRHEVLRTGFEMINGRPVQTVSELTVPLPVIDLQHLPAEERESQAIHLMTDAAKQPFDLSQDAVLRAVLYQLSATDYILLLITHHIASDGWSAGILFQELAAFYESHTSNSPLTLPPLPIQYADFAAWQREWFDSDALADQLAYWQSQLGPDLTTLNLPTDYPRPTKQTFQGARHAIQLSPQLSQRLLAFSRQEGVTLFMTLLAAFKVLLHRYTGQAEIVVGSPIANRNRRELEALVGFFANTLVLKSGIEPNQTFRQYLAQVRDVALAAYDHQDVPFEKLVEVLQPERDLSRNPLFQVMFILQNTPAEPVSLPGVSFTPLDVDNGTAKFDLTLAMVETDGGLRAKFEYNTALFESTTIARLAEHFQTLLVRLLDQPDQRLAEVDYLTEAEQQQLLSDWNDTHRPYPENETVVQLFERQVEQSPAGVAVIFPAGDRGKAQQLTYREINSRANQLAHHLKALKVGPGELVGVSMARSVDMIVGILAVLKTGAAYVPLDPAYPRQRLEFMLADSQASVVLTQSEVEANLSAYEGHLIRLDRDWPRIVGQSTANLEVTIKADDPAYVIYTSGSTGTPKGVLGLHRGAVNRFRWMWETYPFAADERCCQKTTLNFVDSVWEIFGPLLQGIPTVLIPDERVKDPDQLVQTLADYQVSRLVLVPSLLRAILDSHPNLQAKLPHLKIWVTSGEALPLELLQRFKAELPDATLINLYGSSEISADSTYFDTRDMRPHFSSVPIGRPIANTQLYVLDTQRQPVAIGIRGELYVGGHGLAQGYHRRPDLTAERFMPNPLWPDRDDRLFKTGDLVRYLPDGNLEYLGRIDHQVKIRGMRIELGEIESCLVQHELVDQVVVVASEDSAGEKRLVAYLVLVEPDAVSIAGLRAFLSERLPDYMVPSVFMLLEAMPLTPNGKINRLKRPEPGTNRSDFEQVFGAPRNLVELQLTKLWEQVLEVQPVGVQDNFFTLGGHSMLAVRLLLQIEQVFGKRLPLTALFQAPTVEKLAEAVGDMSAPEKHTSIVALQPGGHKRPFFCLPGNLGNVFTDLNDLVRHFDPARPFYALQDGPTNPTDIKALAAHYLNEIRAIQPEGPYLLGGICSGGVVAFEMAQQLLAAGQDVDFLALIEPSRPGPGGISPKIDVVKYLIQRTGQRLGRHVKTLVQGDIAEQQVFIGLKRKVVSNIWAMSHYVPKIYPGKLKLFLTPESINNDAQNHRLDWCNLAQDDVEIITIPGTHNTITGTDDAKIDEVHMKVLANQLNNGMFDLE